MLVLNQHYIIIENIKKIGPDRFLNCKQLSANKGEGTQENFGRLC